MDFVVQNNVLCKYKGHDGAVVIPEGVTAIGDSAFRECDSLQSVTIPAGVTEIGESAFYWCKNLQSVTIPERVTEIGKSTFESCISLQSVTIPAGVTKIGSYAFQDCRALQSVTIPEGITSIGKATFWDCERLQSVTIQANACKIGELAFQNSHHVLIAPHIPISGFPDINKPAVCAGFAKLYCDQFPLSEEIRAGYLAYIRDQRKSLYAKAMEYLPLLQLMAAEKMILPEDFEELFQDALQKGGSKQTALLLEYRHKYLGLVD